MDTQRLAVIDLGSNTTRLIVMDYVPGRMYKLVDEIREQVRLAEGMGADNVLQSAAMRRAVHAMAMFATFCRTQHIRHILPVATSAVRDARNRRHFLNLVRAEAGLDMRVISGEAEAYYAALGALNSLDFADGFVVDLGGGSVQVAEVRGRRFVRGASLPLGTVRLTEEFVRSDPVDASEYRALADHVKHALRSLDWFEARKGLRLIGLGGTIRNLAKIDCAARAYPLDLLHGYVLPARRVARLTAHLRRLPVDRRARLPGLKADRADVILAGAVVVRQLLRHSGFDELTVCGHGVREGVFFEEFLRRQAEPVLADVRRFGVLNLARQYGGDTPHCAHVARLADRLFDALHDDYEDRGAEREWLWAAAQLHDIGTAVDYRDHQRHSEYLLLNAGLDGHTHREIALLALLVRHHRSGGLDTHPFHDLLERGDRKRLARLVAILRLAEMLERGRRQVVTGLDPAWDGDTLCLRLHTAGDAEVEKWEAERNLDLFEKAFGFRVRIE